MKSFDNYSGKIDNQQFKDLVFHSLGKTRSEVIVGAQFGVDAALIDLGEGKVLATSSDPLSLIPTLGLKESAWLSVHLLANDMATTGFAPQYAQFVLNLPLTLSATDFNTYWQYIHQFCIEIGVSITGGHTGKIPDQNSTISGGGTFFLTAPKNKVLTSNNAKVGDAIIVTKSAGMTASSILAKSFPDIVEKAVGTTLHQKACNLLFNTSVLPEALLSANILLPNKELNAMHDVTEGGVLGAINEMAQASCLGFSVHKDQIPIYPEVKAVCDFFQLDPTICVGAGSMVLSVNNSKADELIFRLKQKGIECSMVGQFIEKKEGELVVENGEPSVLSLPEKDPYWAAFFNALNKGWK